MGRKPFNGLMRIKLQRRRSMMRSRKNLKVWLYQFYKRWVEVVEVCPEVCLEACQIWEGQVEPHQGLILQVDLQSKKLTRTHVLLSLLLEHFVSDNVHII